jgi:hypothetical protein
MNALPIPSLARRPGRVLLLLLVAVPAALAEPRFAITRGTSDGGGDRSASNSVIKGQPPRFALTGTIGQPEAAPRLVSASPRFAVQPGFWSHYSVVQQPGTPRLAIRNGTGGQVVLAWPVADEGFILQQSPDLSPDSWTTVSTPVVDTATEHTVTVPVTGPRMFFRLRGP